MIEFIKALEKKLDARETKVIDECNSRLINDFNIELTPESEVGIFLEMANSGFYPKDKLYDFLYKFIDFYEQDEDYLNEFANIIVFAVSNDWLDPIDGSRLIGSLWGTLGYPDQLADFIGTEGEVEYLDNRLKSSELTPEEKKDIENKLRHIRIKLKFIATNYIQNNTF